MQAASQSNTTAFIFKKQMLEGENAFYSPTSITEVANPICLICFFGFKSTLHTCADVLQTDSVF